jgi:hypothetical protein
MIIKIKIKLKVSAMACLTTNKKRTHLPKDSGPPRFGPFYNRRAAGLNLGDQLYGRRILFTDTKLGPVPALGKEFGDVRGKLLNIFMYHYFLLPNTIIIKTNIKSIESL